MIDNIAPQVSPAIIVMAKVPRAGRVKTRLRPFLSGEQASELAVCFLQDTISTIKNLSENVIVAFTPAGERRTIEAVLPGDLSFIEQKGHDLTERLESVIEFAANRNFSPIIVIGADSPTLPAEFVRKAIESFESDETDIALGATEDGGFYLIGLRGKYFGLFENIRWSSEFVFRQTAENIERLNLKLFQLPRWYDVDTADDLIFLREKMLSGEENGKSAPKTFEWLISNSALFDSL